MRTKYCALNYFFTQRFPSCVYLQKFFEKFMKTKYCISNYFATQIFPSYIYLRKLFEMFMKKNIVCKRF